MGTAMFCLLPDGLDHNIILNMNCPSHVTVSTRKLRKILDEGGFGRRSSCEED